MGAVRRCPVKRSARRVAEAERVLGVLPADPYPDVECRLTIRLSFEPGGGGERWECWNIGTGEPVEATAEVKRAVLARWEAEPGPKRFTLEPVTVYGPDAEEQR